MGGEPLPAAADRGVRPLAFLAAYAHNDDLRAAACNRIALVVLSNQPFYPFYVLWLVGGEWRVAFLTWLSAPAFAAVPAIARRDPVVGRAALVVVGTFNTVMSLWAFGAASGVALFLAPIAMIAGMAFRRSERTAMLAVIAVPFIAFAVVQTVPVTPIGRFDAYQYRHFLGMNAWSVACLTAFVSLVFAPALDPVSPPVSPRA